MKNWYNIKAMAGGQLAISIHDEIGLWGISAKQFIQDLQAETNVTEIAVSINSPGGSVFDGLAIYNSLRHHNAKVVTRVEGIAASIASVILMAGDEITMPEDAFVMIHNPWTFAMGDAEEMRETAATLDKLRDSLLSIYHKQTGLELDELTAMLNQETWLNGHDALAKGFITKMDEPAKIAAIATDWAKHFSRLPQALTEGGNIAQTLSGVQTITDFENFLREAGGLSKGLAKALTSRAKDLIRREAGESDAETQQRISNLSNLLRG